MRSETASPNKGFHMIFRINRVPASATLFFVLLLNIGCASHIQKPLPDPEAETSLWRVDSPTTAVYLLGSIHVLKQSDYPLPPAMEHAYDQAERLVFEVHLDSADSPMAQAKILTRSFLRGDSTLADCIPDTLLRLVHRQAETLGVQPSMFNKMKPWMVGMTLSLLKMQRSGIQPQYGVDFYFFRRARLEEKPVKGLESVEFQADLLGRLSVLNQTEYLRYTLQDLDRLNSELGKMTDAWRTGDTEALEALLVEGFKEYPELYEAMVVERNRRWMRRIRSRLADDVPTLFVVGAAHLVGEDGLVRLLKKEGHLVQQL